MKDLPFAGDAVKKAARAAAKKTAPVKAKKKAAGK